jgi:ELWxxDGT repeat protein
MSFTVAGGKLYFSADDGTNGRELWVTDGVTLPTMVKNINGTSADSLATGLSGEGPALTAVGNIVYFQATGGVAESGERQLWKSDGTLAGTVEFHDFTTDGSNADIYFTIDAGSGSFFTSVGTPAEGVEIYYSSGGGTPVIRDIVDTSQASASTDPTTAAFLGGTLYFRGLNASSQPDIYKTDGSALPVIAVDSGAFADPDQLTVANGKLFFEDRVAGASDYELFVHDPAGPTTTQLTTLPAAAIRRLHPFNNVVTFLAEDSSGEFYFWKSDGTVPGTVKIDKIGSASNERSERPIVADGKFWTKGGQSGSELWVSDATPAGTFEVMDVSPGAVDPLGPLWLTNLNGTVLFHGQLGSDLELFKVLDKTPDQELTVTSTGNGYVQSDPGGITCRTDCTRRYPNGTVVQLIAFADDDPFTSWGGACAGDPDNVCNVTMDQARSVSAFFGGGGPTTFPLNVTVNGSGDVTSNPAGITCPGDCSENYTDGTLVTLTADPDAGNNFQGWSGACTGTSTCQVTMNAARSVTATFVAGPPPPSLVISDVAKREGDGGRRRFGFTISLSGASAQPVSVEVDTANGPGGGRFRPARAGSDYRPIADLIVTFAPGETSKSVVVTVKGDDRIERNERFSVLLSQSVNASVADALGLGTIRKDD